MAQSYVEETEMDEKELLTNDAAGEAAMPLSDKEMDSVSGGFELPRGRGMCVTKSDTWVYKNPLDTSSERVGFINGGKFILRATLDNTGWVRFDLSFNRDVHVDRSRIDGNTAYIKDADVNWR